MVDEYNLKYWTIEHTDSSDGYSTYYSSFGTYRRKPNIDDYEIIADIKELYDMMNGNCYLHELLEKGFTGNLGYGFKLVERCCHFKYDKLHGE